MHHQELRRILVALVYLKLFKMYIQNHPKVIKYNKKAISDFMSKIA
jgi:hypothetical protein